MRAGLVVLLVILAAVTGGCSQVPEEDPSPTSPGATSDKATPTSSPSPRAFTLNQARDVVGPAVARVTVSTWSTGVKADDDHYYDGCAVGTGTAFAIHPQLLVTAAHVVEDADRIRVTFGSVTTPGTVVGYDRRKDVALIRVERTTPGLLMFAESPAEVGDEVATLGYAEGLGLSFLRGDVNRVNGKSDVAGNFMTGLTEVDFATKGGNSGGPVFDTSGAVVGILVAGPKSDGAGGRLVVPSSTASPLVERWRAEPDTGDLADNPCPLLPGDWVPAGTGVEDEYSPAVHSAALTIQSYLQGINNGDYRTAHAQLAGSLDYDDFVDGVETSRISDLEYDVVDSAESPVIDVDFTTQQDEGEGPTGRPEEECTLWHLRYRFTARDDMWLINKSTASPGELLNEPCGGDLD